MLVATLLETQRRRWEEFVQSTLVMVLIWMFAYMMDSTDNVAEHLKYTDLATANTWMKKNKDIEGC
jgi:hypothetical protein